MSVLLTALGMMYLLLVVPAVGGYVSGGSDQEYLRGMLAGLTVHVIILFDLLILGLIWSAFP